MVLLAGKRIVSPQQQPILAKEGPELEPELNEICKCNI